MDTNKKPDIIDFALNHTMSLTAFQHVQELLNSQDIHIVASHQSEKPCGCCKTYHVIDMAYGLSRLNYAYNYSICLNCWQISLWMPVYEGEDSKK